MALITELDDRSLVEQHHAGDENAFRQIVERHHRSLYANALRRLHDPELAEDAVQEALLRAYRALPRFNGDYHLDAWLHRIITNVCHDMGRRLGRDSRLFDRACTEHDVAAPPADDPLETMPRQQLEEALSSLPENYREVLLLRFVDELSYEDVALKAGISEENARARVSRGRAMLRRLLDGAAGALIWLLPPLRRNQLTGGEADKVTGEKLSAAANLADSASPIVAQAAPAASQSTPVLTQASNFVNQAMPGLMQAAPAVTSSAPTMGKAAVAVGIAASVAIPTGVAVENRLDKPEPVTAPAADDAQAAAPDEPVEVASSATAPSTTVATPSTSTTAAVAPLGDGGATDVALEGSTTTTETTTTTEGSKDDGTTDSGTGTPVAGPAPTTPPTDGSDDSDDGTTAEPAPAPPGELSSSITVVEAGPRLELNGDFTLDVDGRSITGTLTGKLLIGEADPKNPEAPRQVEGDLLLEFADGTTAELRLRGEVTISSQGAHRLYDLSAIYRLEGGADHGVAESGDLAGAMQVKDGSGKLALNLPGARSE